MNLLRQDAYCLMALSFMTVILAPCLVFAMDNPVTHQPVAVFDVTMVALAAMALIVALLALRNVLRPAGLRKRLVSSFLLVSLLPISVLAILDHKVTSEALTENSRQAMLTSASQTAGAIESFILANLSTVRTESTIPQFSEYLKLPPAVRIGSGEEQAVMGILNSLKRRDQTNITSIAILDRTGRSVADTYGPDIGQDKSGRNYYLRPMKTGLPYVSDVGFSVKTNQASLYFSSPIRDTAGEILGILRVRYNSAILQKLLLPSGHPEELTYSAILFDNQGLRLADSKHPEFVLSPSFPLGEDVLKKIGSDRRIRVSPERLVSNGISWSAFTDLNVTYFNSSLYGADGVPTLNVKVPIRYVPWTLVLGYSEAANLARISTQSHYALAVVFGIVLIVVLASLAVIRNITRPVLSLTEAARELSKGKEAVTVSIESRDEIGELAATFNRMSKALYASQQKVLASSERLQSLLDTLPDAVVVHDVNGNFLDVNHGFEEMFGFSAGEAKRFSLKDICGTGFCETEALKLIWVCVEEGPQAFDWTVRRKDGGELLVHTKLRRFDSPEGIRVMALTSDITERKKAELKLLQARNYIANIIDSMPSVLVGVDTQGAVTQWNSQAERVTGLKKDDAVDKQFEDVLPRLSGEMKRVREAMQSGIPFKDSKRIYSNDGNPRYEDVTIFPLVADRVDGAVIRVDDVTERVQLEQMLVQSEKMLSVGGLAAGMAHEINNPLAGMLQNASVLFNRLSDTDLPANLRTAEKIGISMENIKNYMAERKISQFISAINESGSRIAVIVNNMLSFARKSDDQVSFHRISELLDKTLGLAGADFDLKGHFDFKMIDIKKDYETELPPIPCEGTQIQQVLLNIFRNGAQAMQEAGTKTPRFTIRTRLDNRRNTACLEIEDNGPGMDKTTMRRVFEPFFTTKPVGIGTGLGLSVSYFIITENHGGQMRVESCLGHGTKFIIHLPYDGKAGRISPNI